MTDTDTLNVIHPGAAGPDVHRVRITATVRIARVGSDAEVHSREFSALSAGPAELTDRLTSHQVTTAAMEGTEVCREAVFDALDAAGIRPLLFHARHVKRIRGRRTDVADSMWLARICRFGLCTPSLVLPFEFRELRRVSRGRRTIVAGRSRTGNRIHRIHDGAGIRAGGVLSDQAGKRPGQYDARIGAGPASCSHPVDLLTTIPLMTAPDSPCRQVESVCFACFFRYVRPVNFAKTSPFFLSRNCAIQSRMRTKAK